MADILIHRETYGEGDAFHDDLAILSLALEDVRCLLFDQFITKATDVYDLRTGNNLRIRTNNSQSQSAQVKDNNKGTIEKAYPGNKLH